MCSNGHGCGCGCQCCCPCPPRFERRFFSREEKIEGLECYRQDIEAELEALKKEIEELKAEG